MDVIEIDSTPEPEPMHTPLRRRTPLFLPEDDDVIELTDSSEDAIPIPRKKRKTFTPPPVAGPSRSQGIAACRRPTPSQASVKPNSIATRSAAKGKAPASQPVTPAAGPQAPPSSASQAPRFPSSLRGSTSPRDASPPYVVPAAPRVSSPMCVATPRLDAESASGPGPGPEPAPAPIFEPVPEPAVPVQPELVDPAELFDMYVAQVCEIVPDVAPAHVYDLLERFKTQFPNDLVGWVVQTLFEDQSYPKDVKGKGKAKAVDTPMQAAIPRHPDEIDYISLDRTWNNKSNYNALAMEQLLIDFSDIEAAHIYKTWDMQKKLYAPTYLSLYHQKKSGNPPYVPEEGRAREEKVRKRLRGKRKAALNDAAFTKEREWVVRKVQDDKTREAAKEDQQMAEKLNEQEYEENGEGLECGCCFSSSPFDKMIQCPDAHLFCTDCVISYAGSKLGEHNPDLTCMDMSQCKLRFPDSELRRILPDKLLELYERVRQRREVEAAGLESLEECPFCDFKVVMEVDFEANKLLRCQNEDCMRVSCRNCKKEDHLPKTCQEVEEDKKLDGKHAIEEAMTRALMRNCPKCQKGFIKESGCNKMTCPNCRSLSCYVCRQIITGYEHFDQGAPQRAGTSRAGGKCPLWDAVEQRHTDEVIAAAKKAMDEYKLLHPDVDDRDLKVDLPPPPPPPPQLHPHPGAVMGRIPAAPGQHHIINLPNVAYRYEGLVAQMPQVHVHLQPAPPAPAPPDYVAYAQGALHVRELNQLYQQYQQLEQQRHQYIDQRQVPDDILRQCNLAMQRLRQLLAQNRDIPPPGRGILPGGVPAAGGIAQGGMPMAGGAVPGGLPVVGPNVPGGVPAGGGLAARLRAAREAEAALRVVPQPPQAGPAAAYRRAPAAAAPAPRAPRRKVATGRKRKRV